jgi:cell wall assembly regulator SMI1
MLPRITDSGPPLSLDDVEVAERQLRVRFPDDYRSFLLAHNGGSTAPAWLSGGRNLELAATLLLA